MSKHDHKSELRAKVTVNQETLEQVINDLVRKCRDSITDESTRVQEQIDVLQQRIDQLERADEELTELGQQYDDNLITGAEYVSAIVGRTVFSPVNQK